jgi:hypothetical protein
MQQLAKRKSRLVFEVDTVIQKRSLIVEPEPLICTMRLKAKRHRISVSWESIFVLAAQIAAQKIREERKLARQKKRRQ